MNSNHYAEGSHTKTASDALSEKGRKPLLFSPAFWPLSLPVDIPSSLGALLLLVSFLPLPPSPHPLAPWLPLTPMLLPPVLLL